MNMVENPMVLDRLWPAEPKAVCECEGCGEEIYPGEAIVILDGFVLHEKKQCAFDYVTNLGCCGTAGQ